MVMLDVSVIEPTSKESGFLLLFCLLFRASEVPGVVQRLGVIEHFYENSLI